MSRVAIVVLFASVAIAALAVPAAPAAAQSPWWQVLSGSRPTNLWEPTSNEQEIKAEVGEFGGEVGGAIEVEVEGTVVACLGTKNLLGEAACSAETGFAAIETAAELEALLESTYGTPAVEASGGPFGSAPFLVTVPRRGVPALVLSPIVGSAEAIVLSQGGSGRLVLTISNLGPVPVDGGKDAVTIVDELPAGLEATGVEAFAGFQGAAGPVSCGIEASDLVSCSFEDALPPYEAIEVEILASLVGEPPVAGTPGKVTVSGGNAPSESAVQQIKVTPEMTPFGIEHFSAAVEEAGGDRAIQAGGHPFQMSTTFQLNSGELLPGATRRDTVVEQPALPRNLRFPLPVGLTGSLAGMPRCKMSVFLVPGEAITCPPETAIGVASVTAIESAKFGLVRMAVPLFNLQPALGEPARFGIEPVSVPVVVNTEVDPDNGYRVVASVNNTTQVAQLLSSTVVVWGTPGDPEHDAARGSRCLDPTKAEPCERPVGLGEQAFLRQPVSCTTPLEFNAEIEPWNVPTGSLIAESAAAGGLMGGCNRLPFGPEISAIPSSTAASSPTGLSFRLDMPNAGLLNPKAVAAEGQAKKVEVTLPEGVTANPSQANGLGACNPADYAREQFDSPAGAGCPESSKIGSVDITTPLLEEEAHGAVYLAKPFDNPFDSLLALYMVAKIPERGVLVKQAGKVELNPGTGQLVTTFDDLPQLPFETFDLNFFGGSRAPLAMPSKCGDYDIVAEFTPWHASDPDNPQPGEVITRTSTFTVDQGPNGTPCPSGALPFNPGFTAGTTNNAAGSYAPFIARLTRSDGEQEFSRFSIQLPQGLVGKLAGVPPCPEGAIAVAMARAQPNGAQEEIQSPSCPFASQVGGTLVGAGVGSALSYVPGKLYLAGPYQGSKLSIIAITMAKVGPFDLGTVVIRQALRVNPETAEVSTDGVASTPIPHIVEGIVVHARDIRVNIDRPNFVLNPTSCERSEVVSAIFGSGMDFGSTADDQLSTVSTPFQAAGCARLGFRPKFSLWLRGGTKRGKTPRLRAVLRARTGDANMSRAQVTLPDSAFLEQAHIRTICTRVQFRAGSGNGEGCPKGAIYGRAKAFSPLLDEPLSGPVFLRSSNNELPDLVAALHSTKVDINLVGRIDSLKGRIRTTFAPVPDAPVSRFVFEMQGGRRGLIVNSTNICRGRHRAIANFKGQNGRRQFLRPVVKAQCKDRMKKKRNRHNDGASNSDR